MKELKIDEILHGFAVKRSLPLPDIAAVMYEMEYKRNGAKLIFLDREDENKTFSVGFKTTPVNSTGVFHIIEHSVLCGSIKYQVKEPFVELLKSSLQTFLNAMTFPDKTVYPISSRNDKDFLNLADVYLDAVFNPLMKTNKGVFLQEGWRRELNEDGTLSYNGVVYNEMKGAYSSPDGIAESVSAELLYGADKCYGYDSGGDPEHIPELSYEEFCASHSKFYHPSNAYFFLDGEIDLDKTLALIEGYISDYDALEIDTGIPDASCEGPVSREIEYEISEGESGADKARLVNSYLSTRYDEQEEILALDILIDAISSGNDSPLKKAVLDSELCESFDLMANNGRLRNNITASFQNVKDGKIDELEALFLATLNNIRNEGIDRDALVAAINRYEFLLRERNMGGLPLGIAYAISVFDTWLYGGAPEAMFSYSESFERLRSRLNEGYFESLIEKYILKNEKRSKLVMLPSSTLGERRKARELEARARERAALGEDEIALIKRESEILHAWQNSVDTPELLATLPTLDVSDIPKDAASFPIEVEKISGGELIRHDVKTMGIYYTDLYFDISDIDDIYIAPIFAAMLSMSGTEKHDAFAFETLKKRELGSLSAGTAVYKRKGAPRLYLTVSASMLDGKRDEFLKILTELLYEATLSDKNALRNIVRQRKIVLESSFATRGDSLGFTRCLAYSDATAAVNDKLSGYDFFAKIKEIDKNFDTLADSLVEKMRALRDKIFTRERLTLAVTGEADRDFEKKIQESLKNGTACESVLNVKPLGALSEGIAIPAQVGFGVLAASLPELEKYPNGALNVARLLLNYEYLWCEVRVKGGAYGVAFRTRADGTIGYTSYRDPTPKESIEVFRKTPEFLREFAENVPELTKYIIGAMGEFEPYLSKPSAASVSTMRYLSGISDEMRAKLRREILETDKAALLRVAELLEKVNAEASELLVAPKDKLAGCENVLVI